MQDIQASLHPFIKLAQSNFAVMCQFTLSPEVVSQAMSGAAAMRPPAGRAEPAAASGSGALTELMRGMLKNYTEFLGELGQAGVAMLAQGQSAMLQKAQDASSTLAPTSARERRAR